MAKGQEYTNGRSFLIRLSHKMDLLSEITGFCKENKLTAAFISAIGAVEQATIGYFDQEKREYQSHAINKPMEITHLAGNLSKKDGKPMIHAHIILADKSGRTFSGHLMSPTAVFACEVFLQELIGPALARDFDEETSLPLWKELG